MRQRPVSLREQLHLAHTSVVPLHRQIYLWMRQAILDGQLQPGQRLPSTRTLASELGVSRNTASSAYEELQAEEFIERTVGSGTVVARVFSQQLPRGEAQSSQETPSLHLSPLGQALLTQMKSLPLSFRRSPSQEPGVFRLGVPDLEQFPSALWSQLLARHMRRSLSVSLDYQEIAGYPALREAIAAHIAVTRGVRCQVDQVLITPGTQASLDLLGRILVSAGDTVWMEDPGYPPARAVLEGIGASLAFVPVDAQGLDVIAGRALAPRARLAYVTPSHQFPLGVTMKLERRLALLQWAREAQAWILEDDYDSEYRFNSHPVEALQGLDRANRTIYLGSFSKVLFPSLRLGYMVVPEALIEPCKAAQRFQMIHPPFLEQMVLADFFMEGHFARHLRRMRALYAARRTFLLTSLERMCGHLLTAHPPDAGLHLVAWLPPGVSDSEVEQHAGMRGIEVVALSSLSRQPLAQGGLVLGYATGDEGEIQAGVHVLADIIRACHKAPR
ncbi:MocR-like pyridoxine biosynthesis transcription factor PdxR [Tengunoibacter tsumagoiensis]|uniref:GntR family transcriptional regulator n=1 Tax=Tengunoibacter tsumagoiensis TaxID=2014871 RepID=A0A402A5W3_9CHLR|nr:PLP-dependent aminotransferase family protein [Tengunoibacter tsumagoiensis]GCE14537.1 GntR family transcriptional regulator [Tengunoibacter tsumagoiensis]